MAAWAGLLIGFISTWRMRPKHPFDRERDRYGERCREADILPAAVIEAALDAHIHSWLDGAAWRQRDAEIERARKLL